MPCSHRSPDSNIWVSNGGYWRLLEACSHTHDDRVACCGDPTCLRQHLAEKHGEVFDHTCGRATNEQHYSFYLEALAVKEQERMPMVGASIDRRTFQHVAADITEQVVRSMVCMCCARVSLSTSGTSGIALVRAGEYFDHITPTSWENNWCFRTYK